jgi:hypothetical protein
MSIVEQRYQAVLAVVAGDPVTEVAEKIGVSRQSLHAWLRRYADEGLAGLQDVDDRPEEATGGPLAGPGRGWGKGRSTDARAEGRQSRAGSRPGRGRCRTRSRHVRRATQPAMGTPIAPKLLGSSKLLCHVFAGPLGSGEQSELVRRDLGHRGDSGGLQLPDVVVALGEHGGE